MLNFLYVIQILFAIMLIALILLQAKGSGLGSIFGQDGAVFRTRRGAEALLYRMTIFFAIVFCVISLVSVRLASGSLTP